ncbi:MAG: YihY/virulence factor BrkB family protein [Lachnospiraceae bacterium]|nr:YihY/virulence factor BrkB family protein [Lachnospiraceae bacterium]
MKAKIKQFFLDLLEIYTKKRIASSAAQCAFWIILAVIPFVMLVMLVFKRLPVDQSSLMGFIEYYFPGESADSIMSVTESMTRNTNPAVLVIAIIGALWTSSKAMLSIRQGLNEIYGVRETRSFLYVRLIGFLYVLLFAAALVITLIFMGMGNRVFLKILSYIPFVSTNGIVVWVLRLLLSIIVLSFLFMLFYTFFSNQKQKFLFQFPGALVASIGWVFLSYIFSFYFDNTDNLTYIYGSLASLMMLLLWLVTCLYAFFIGAAVNSIRATNAKRRRRAEMEVQEENGAVL